MVPPDVAAFEFYRLLSYGISWEKLVLIARKLDKITS
jgi:hypothetical protein